MIISERAIYEEIDKGNIIVRNSFHNSVKGESIDVRLWEWMRVYVEESKEEYWHNFLKEGEYFVNKFDRFYICHTIEYIWTRAGSNILPTFKLKSSSGRAGIIHTLAWHGDVWFFNRWAMEFMCAKPITLKYWMVIGQIYFTYTTPSGDYSEKWSYQKTNDINETIEMWKKEDILWKPLKVII
jgi:deoxycytidine triphosphate deaminase